jgi:hypothetical protein
MCCDMNYINMNRFRDLSGRGVCTFRTIVVLGFGVCFQSVD